MIKHNAHLRLFFKNGKTDFDGIYASSKWASMDIVKSRLSPLMNDITTCIDITRGGVIDKEASVLAYAKDKLGFITESRGWVNSSELLRMFPEYGGKFDKYLSETQFRWNDVMQYMKARPKFVSLIELGFMRQIMDHYSLQGEVLKPYYDKLVADMELAEPVEMSDGSLVDIWNGEILREAPKVVEVPEVVNPDIPEIDTSAEEVAAEEILNNI